jgi:hypothetical protein
MMTKWSHSMATVEAAFDFVDTETTLLLLLLLAELFHRM